MIRIGLCDDVSVFVERLAEIVEDWAEKRLIRVKLESFQSGEEMVIAQEQQGDFLIAFIDVELKGMNGVETALKLRESNRMVDIVFVSQYDRYFRQMFAVYPCRFMEKPISVQKVFGMLDQIVEEQKLYHECFSFKHDRITFNIDLGQVLYFASEKRMIRILMENGREHAFYEKMDELEEILNGYNNQFLRIHQSYLVNGRQIEQYHPRHVIMRNGDMLSVSRGRRRAVCKFHMEQFKAGC
ncbi:MAG: LytTR family DNA-binding domain-containing protein [Firmicutes bacterium]|nr:LytTR family DNA-binding domain-containing protein [Bacillota bacterium]